MLGRIAFLGYLGAVTVAHDMGIQLNAELGVPGFPDCKRSNPHKNLSVAMAAEDLVCGQRAQFEGSVKVACVGDSITAGVHASGGAYAYPAQLQILLDQKHGAGKYEVTNLGACGSTMQKGGNSPFWQRPQYPTLTKNKWDVVIIMLGTNDAKDPGSHGPNNWKHDCGGDLSQCTFAKDYAAFIEVVRGLGKTSAGPVIWSMIPPPLMAEDAYGMNQTVINDVFPRVVREITEQNKLNGPVDLFAAMGGVADWKTRFPKTGCSPQTMGQWPPCKYFCTGSNCDQCHPGDDGYHYAASWIEEHVFGGAASQLTRRATLLV